MEAIILAGGLGTRLRSVTKDAMPKCMAPINGKPFLYYLLWQLQQQGVQRIILSLGHKASVILDWIKEQDFEMTIDYVIEETPLGTGGGIRLALQQANEENCLIVNGDTLFLCSITTLLQEHVSKQAAVTLALKNMKNYDRYGSVVLGADGTIQRFEEKQYKKEGWINAGVYIVQKQALLAKPLPTIFSFEKDYLEAYLSEHRFYGVGFDSYFIDIGIPEDYQQAQLDFLTLFP